MPLFVVLALGVSLAIYFIPVWLLRHKAYARAQDYFVCSQGAPPSVIQNASIAYTLRMATFGPFFAWGASGDFWPAIIGSAFCGLGLYLIYVLRQPMLEFLDSALSRDRSITIAEFIARQHGNDHRVRLLASGLTVFALIGIILAEAIGVAALLKPVLSDNPSSTIVFSYGMLLIMVLCTMLAGNSGVMRSGQSQLGLLYLGLFGSTALLMYVHVSSLRPMPPHGTFALAMIAACCAIMLAYRRTRYVDTIPIEATNHDRAGKADAGRGPLVPRLFRRYEKVLNVCISTAAAFVVVIALMESFAKGFAATASESVAALLAPTRMSGLGLFALALLPLFHQIVDLTNWQRLAAFEKDAEATHIEPPQRSAALRKFFTIYALESPLMWLFMCMFGAIAVVSTETPDGADVMSSFIVQLSAQDNSFAIAALSLLLVSVFAIALSTMSAAFSASLCTIRYDMLPALWPELTSGQAAGEAMARRHTLMVGGGLCLVIAIAFYMTDTHLQISVTSNTFLALLFAFYCAQLSFVPLVLGALIGRRRAGFTTVSPQWALLIVGTSAAIGIGAAAVSIATRQELWLWAAVPACLASGLLLFTIARLWPGNRKRQLDSPSTL
jgi:hypothetical protein